MIYTPKNSVDGLLLILSLSFLTLQIISFICKNGSHNFCQQWTQLAPRNTSSVNSSPVNPSHCVMCSLSFNIWSKHTTEIGPHQLTLPFWQSCSHYVIQWLFHPVGHLWRNVLRLKEPIFITDPSTPILGLSNYVSYVGQVTRWPPNNAHLNDDSDSA